MTDPIRFDPNSVEGNYGMEMACFLVHRTQPQSVRICTSDPETAAAAVRRLACLEGGLTVESEQIAEVVVRALGIRPALVGEAEPDIALVLFSHEQYAEPPRARRLLVLGHNALSYKSLLYPGKVRDNVISQVHWLRRGYTLDERVGLFGPSFLMHWALSLAAGPHLAPYHFQLGQRAMDHLYVTGLFWWMGYITILVGRRRA